MSVAVAPDVAAKLAVLESFTAAGISKSELARRIGRTAGIALRVVPAEQAPWHPGRCASIRVGDWIVGFLSPVVGEAEHHELPLPAIAYTLMVLVTVAIGVVVAWAVMVQADMG